MSDEDAGRTFVSRWSRRKIAARQGQAAPEPPVAAPAQVPADAQVPAEAVADETRPAPAAAQPDVLPDVETLKGVESEYRDFLQPGVDESLRRTALKKLFADPHFNVMDGLDVYIDDYSKPDPIPSALLRSLNQARGLKLFDDEEQEEAAAAAADAATPQTRAHEHPEQVTDAAAAPSTQSTQCPLATEGADDVPDADTEKRKSG